MKKRILAALVALAALPATQQASYAVTFFDGYKLYELCKYHLNNDKSAEAASYNNSCDAYIIGSVDQYSVFLDVINTLPKLGALPKCFANSVSYEQVVNVVINYLRNNTADWKYSAAYIVKKAVVSSFCPGEVQSIVKQFDAMHT